MHIEQCTEDGMRIRKRTTVVYLAERRPVHTVYKASKYASLLVAEAIVHMRTLLS